MITEAPVHTTGASSFPESLSEPFSQVTRGAANGFHMAAAVM
jgi:hypothetical protein